ncbi:hypothetical protein [Chitinophaga flava]|nr:hypothetical protein [Chitinophaga flava]
MRTSSPWSGYCIAAGCGLSILFFLHFHYQRWNPFMLTGPQFLIFYILLIIATGTNILLAWQRQPAFARRLNAGCLLIGIARMIQGLYHHKPVGFLLLLLLLPMITAFTLRQDNK